MLAGSITTFSGERPEKINSFFFFFFFFLDSDSWFDFFNFFFFFNLFISFICGGDGFHVRIQFEVSGQISMVNR